MIVEPKSIFTPDPDLHDDHIDWDDFYQEFSLNKPYRVFAVFSQRAMKWYALINNGGYLVFRYAYMFCVIDGGIRDDWEINYLYDDDVLIVGPHFVAKDKQSFFAMIDRETWQNSNIGQYFKDHPEF